jgi:hypothetical protein
MTNAEFAKMDDVFRKACEVAEIEVTRRQASKYRNKKGNAWVKRTEAKILVAEGRKA